MRVDYLNYGEFKFSGAFRNIGKPITTNQNTIW